MQNSVSLSSEKKLKSLDQLSEWSVDHKTSAIQFAVVQRNFLARPFRKIWGKFKVYEGLVRTNTEDFSGANIHMIIESDSIYTGEKRRDKHLKSGDFFNVERFPFLRFRSFSFEKGTHSNYILEGDLSIRGIRKRVVIDVSCHQGINDKTGEQKLCFESEFQINRHDYGLQANMFFEAFIESEIRVQLNLEFLKLPGNIY